MRPFLTTAFVLATFVGAAAGCQSPGSPEQVADAFAEAYFRAMDQQRAKEHTALGASEMLDRELQDVSALRADGYTPAQAQSEVHLSRGEKTLREQRVRFPYEVTVVVDGSRTVTIADVELTQIDGAWKVVRVGLAAKPSPL